MTFKRLFSLFLLVFTLSGVAGKVFAQQEGTPPAKEEKKGFDASKVIFGHVSDAHEWHFFTMGETPVVLPLPIIIYNYDKGLSVFSSANFGPEEARHEYNGYRLNEEGKIESTDGSRFMDFSITKNVLSLLISTVLLLLVMLSVAKAYRKKGTMAAPSGMQNAMEVIIVFMRDEVAKPNLGHKYKRYMPLILTIFFFIWINDLTGLIPGGANFLGNIAVTGCLAVVSFLVMIFNGNKHFWSHLLNPPDVPLPIKFLLVPIEIISLFIKPMALMIRLFANMLAGHIVLLSVICMIFIFGALNKVAGIGFVPVSLAFSIFMFFLELLVGAIQAFIFANLTAVFIGQAIEEPHHHHSNGQEYDVSEKEIIA